MRTVRINHLLEKNIFGLNVFLDFLKNELKIFLSKVTYTYSSFAFLSRIKNNINKKERKREREKTK
jgi:hypothetical protein